MSNKPREWPNVAKMARDRAAEEAVRGLHAIRPMLHREFTETEKVRRLATAVDALQLIARHLESVGAQTRPE
jgi:hypothetical protein